MERPAPVARPKPPPKRFPRDVLFAVVLPIVCLGADPGILRPGGLVDPIWPENTVAANVFVALAMAAFVSWRVWRNGALLVVGPLFVGAAGALAIGVVLLPLSIVLVPALIGLLGLVPFGTAVAFFASGKRAWRAARATHSSAVVLAASIVLGGTLLGVAVGAQRSVNRRATALVQAAVAGDAQREARGIARLRAFGPLADGALAYDAWADAPTPEVRGRVFDAWLRATGQNLEAVFDD